MKLCINCKYSKGSNELLNCTAPKNLITNLTTGESKPRWKCCTTHRNMDLLDSYLAQGCGKQARWFKSKE